MLEVERPGARRSAKNLVTPQCYTSALPVLPSKGEKRDCPDFGWDTVNFPPSSCCVLDLVGEEY